MEPAQTSAERRTPSWTSWTLGMLCGAFAAVLLVNAVLFPPFRAPDERAHVDMAHYLQQRIAAGDGVVYPPDDERWMSLAVQQAARRSGFGAEPLVTPPLRAADAPPHAQPPTFGQLGLDEPSGDRNQMTQHPPLYYAVTGLVAGRLHDAPYDRHVVLLRLVGALLLVPLPLLCAAAARQLGVSASGQVAAAVVPLTVPMLAHVGASVNNDTLLTVLVAGLTPLLLAAAAGRSSPWRAVLIGALAGAGMLTKGFGMVLAGWIVVAYSVALVRTWQWSVALHALVALATTGIAGGWWWARNLLLLGEVQPHHHHLPAASPEFVADWGWWAGFAALRFTRRFWIEPDTVAKTGQWELLPTVLLAGLLTVAAVQLLRRSRPADPLVALLPAAAITAVVTYGAIGLYRRTGAPFGIHGRYTYPGLAGAAALTGSAIHYLRPRLSTPAVWLLFATAAGMHTWAWHAAVNHYWGAPGGSTTDSTRAMLAWSPLPPGLIATAAVAFWGLLAAAALTTTARRQPGTHASRRGTITL